MGRKPNPSKNTANTIVLSLACESPSQEIVERQATNGNTKPKTVLDSQPENPQPKGSPLKSPNLSVDGVGTNLKAITPQVQMSQEAKQHKKYATFKRKSSKSPIGIVRRSGRIKSAVVRTPTTSQGIEDITVSDSDKDEPPTQIEPPLQVQDPEAEPQPQLELEQEPAENLSGKSLEEKLDYALKRIAAQDKIIELIKSKIDGNAGLYDTPTMSSMSYKSMYIDSQKKLGAITNQNQQLTAELAVALAKIEMYERQNRVLNEPLDKLKNSANAAVSVLSNLAKTAEAVVVGASSHAIDNSASKRMRIEN